MITPTAPTFPFSGPSLVRRYRYTYEAYHDLTESEVAHHDPLDFDPNEAYEITSYRGGRIWNRHGGRLVSVEEVTA